ncbi:hypothetical protein MLD38_010288 [Melastoma candidum]|uniref:Uncharacterized protein n=1 Tax=Melastoma candidum TaxID=119954 RepID=A0ACB9QZC3_9MYRT|nr:hypothetical protein MLD38_010288 [Melastoma candidum]
MELRFFAQLKRLLGARKQGVEVYSRTCEVETSPPEHMEDVERSQDQDNDRGDGDATASTNSLQRAVKSLHFGDEAGKISAAKEIGKMARGDPKAKRLFGVLGVVHALVNMMVSDDERGFRRRSAAIGALLELCSGESHKNQELMLEEGILMRLPKDVQMFDQETRRAVAELLLELSATKNVQLGPKETSNCTRVVISTLESDSEHGTKVSVLGALYHFSCSLENAARLTSNEMIELLLRLSSSKDFSEKALATLGNIIVTVQGKKALESCPMAPENLIEILTWEDRPKCQELSAYVLMILAHQSVEQRQKMAKSGIVQVLLELALLGRSTLAQKRAMKLLQWFKDERGARIGPHSGPQTGARSLLGSSSTNSGNAHEGRLMMKKLVKESLHRNMEAITRRANNSDASDESTIKTLVVSTSSKSLPY